MSLWFGPLISRHQVYMNLSTMPMRTTPTTTITPNWVISDSTAYQLCQKVSFNCCTIYFQVVQWNLCSAQERAGGGLVVRIFQQSAEGEETNPHVLVRVTFVQFKFKLKILKLGRYGHTKGGTRAQNFHH